MAIEASGEIRNLLEQSVDDWNRKRPTAIAGRLADDVSLIHPLFPEPIRGRVKYQAYDTAFLAAFPDASKIVRAIVAEDPYGVLECLLTGTHLGMFMGTPPTHKRLRLPVVEVFRFCNSLICEVHRYFNPLLYVRQLGIEMPMLDPPQA